MLKKILLAAPALTMVAGTAWALDEKQATRATETRQAVLKIVGWNVGPMAGMVKERIPYDAKQFELHAGRVAFMSTMLVDAFRPDTREFSVETAALDPIWDEFAEFEDLAKKMTGKAEELHKAAKGGDFATVQAAFTELGQSCKNCHDKFKEDT